MTEQGYEPNWLVTSADHAADEVEAAGGSLLPPPFDVPAGRVAVVPGP